MFAIVSPVVIRLVFSVLLSGLSFSFSRSPDQRTVYLAPVAVPTPPPSFMLKTAPLTQVSFQGNMSVAQHRDAICYV
ncbi:hypothetical protein N657DRAFT_315435 [Parathielavia appendiculata]|uniref:Secreted protein n=1 Tax=Parathielavia appendiculata TaxID=2587402 RepID=A0AAN6Z6Q6_9PEZI|nr:hypothetical protein N657DRAFT_315435 [Parathielavia appendiculata]